MFNLKDGYKALGNYIRPVDERNKNLSVTKLLGVSISKQFIPSIANIVGTDLSNYKIVRKGQFAYGPVTSRNGEKISIALLGEDDCIISSSYTVFEVVDKNELDPEYLMLWFSRPEFDRYARYMSHGSVREIFDWDELCKVELPVPVIEKQKEIVKAYKTITERIELKRKINDNLESLMQTFYKEINKSNLSTQKLNEFVSFQEGPGIRNWQFVDEGIPFINIRCIQGGEIKLENANCISKEEAFGKYKHFLLNEWDVILSTSGTLGKNSIIRKEHLPLCLNTSIIRFVPKGDFSNFSYMLCMLRSNQFVELMYSVATGSAQVNMGPTQLNKIEIQIPSDDKRKEFHKKIFPLICEQINNLKQISLLEETKEVLLSKMSD